MVVIAMFQRHQNGPGVLPEALEAELLRLRDDYRPTLRRLACGDYSDLVDLTGLELSLTKILTREARRPAPLRRVRLTELAMAMERLFPELKPWRDMQLRDAERVALAKTIDGRRKSIAS